MTRKPSSLWLIPIVFTLPLLQLIFAFLRFGNVSYRLLISSLVFAPTGIVAGIVLLGLLRKSLSKQQQIKTIIGFFLGLPIAMFLTLFGGLILHPFIVTALIGPLPLIMGAFLGYSIGKDKNEVIE